MKLSVILPVYNVERYISQCLDSIYSQHLDLYDFEVICVDDCSPDHSCDIIKDYQKKYLNLIYIKHPYNKRSGGARNTGMSIAKGDYILFIDPDDWIESNSIGDLLQLCYQNDLDILGFNFDRVNHNNEVIYSGSMFQTTDILNGNDWIKKQFGNKFIYYILGFPVLYLFKNSYLKNKNILFPEGVFFQDTTFAFDAIIHSNRMQSVNQSVYKYRYNEGSATSLYKQKPNAGLIYQYAFVAGDNVEQMAYRIQSINPEFSNVLYNLAKQYYNSFVIKLFKSSTPIQKEFYALVEKNKDFVMPLFSKMNYLSRIAILPHFGFYCVRIGKLAYALYRKCKK